MSTIQDAMAKVSKRSADEPAADAQTGGDEAPRRPAEATAESESQGASPSLTPDEVVARSLTQEFTGAVGGGSRFSRLAVGLMREEGLLTPDAKRSRLAEENRRIKLPLLFNVDKKGADIVDNANLIMVTSAVAGEGKTFSAINLAISVAAERDRTVLLVDGDVAKPTAARRLGIEQETGLMDFLDGSVDSIAEVSIRTDLPNFQVVTAGRPHHRATELLASERMAMLMQELCTRCQNRIVIFDSPPLLLASESVVLASMMGQVVMVVAAERTPQHAVADALSRLREDQIVGLVLNKYRPGLGNRVGSGYGYGDGYGYGRES